MVEKLENSKKVSEQVSIAMNEFKEVQNEIAESSNVYSPAAIRSSLV